MLVLRDMWPTILPTQGWLGHRETRGPTDYGGGPVRRVL